MLKYTISAIVSFLNNPPIPLTEIHVFKAYPHIGYTNKW